MPAYRGQELSPSTTLSLRGPDFTFFLILLGVLYTRIYIYQLTRCSKQQLSVPILQISKLRKLRQHAPCYRVNKQRNHSRTQARLGPAPVPSPTELCFFSPGGGKVGKEPHEDDSAHNPKRLAVSLKAIDVTMEASTTCFHPDFYITLYLKTCIKLASVDFARKADFFKVHTFSPRDVDISPVAPSPSHPS